MSLPAQGRLNETQAECDKRYEKTTTAGTETVYYNQGGFEIRVTFGKDGRAGSISYKFQETPYQIDRIFELASRNAPNVEWKIADASKHGKLFMISKCSKYMLIIDEIDKSFSIMLASYLDEKSKKTPAMDRL